MARTLALPLVVGRDGALGALEQDTPEELAQSVGLLLDTRPGERAAVPDYGLPQPLGTGLQPDEVVDVINQWEERAVDSRVEDLVAQVVQDATVHSLTPSQDGA